MKQVLVIEVDRAVQDVVALFLRPDAYELTAVDTPREALALVAYGEFDLVIIGRTYECPGEAWCFVRQIAELCVGRASVLLHVDESDDMLHARVGSLGAGILTAPAEVTAEPATLEQATPS